MTENVDNAVNVDEFTEEPSAIPDTLGRISGAGVSLWLDDLSRERLSSGNLAALTEQLHISGVTTNPTIFAGALSHGDSYRDQLASLAAAGTEVEAAAWQIMTDDVRAACDVLRPIFDATDAVDGRVSIEVDPRLARDTDGTVELARHLWQTVDRPNLLIKVPATREGLPAIATLIGEGISVNVTLIFSLDRYRAVLDAYAQGLATAADAGVDISQIASVASFFVSRVDTAVDAELDAADSPVARTLRGRVALANARAAYEIYLKEVASERWQALAARGGKPQRPLWASTGVKDPTLPDTLYVTELVAAGCVNTAPEKTLRAVADHGTFSGDTITGRFGEAHQVLDALIPLTIDLDEITDRLEDEGVEKFVTSWNELLDSVASGMLTVH